ncbi:hypothetical protein ABTX34_16930 [Streptomyces sp. NPDC096538]|uniref:hypothetical protein n=1 Tax=Streptomyces TaxID=1883 RepID=UPI00331C5610
MSTTTKLHCDTTRGYSACASSLITDGLTVEEARKIGAAHGWRHTAGRDYCPACSGSRVRPRVIIAATPKATTRTAAAHERLQTASGLLLAHSNRATGGTWRPNRTPLVLRQLPGVEFVTGGAHDSECVARTGPAGNEQAAADAAYIALVDPNAGRAVAGVLHEAFEHVHQDHGMVATSLEQACVDLADELLKPKGER